MSELWAIDQFLVSTLKADSTLASLIGGATPRVYTDMAPQTTPPTPLPYVLLQTQAATDLIVVGNFRVWTNSLYYVRGLVESESYGGVSETIANRIEVALNGKSGSNGSGLIYSVTRDVPKRLIETPNGRQIRHNGHLYRIYAKAT